MNFILHAPFQEERLLNALQWVAWAAVIGVLCFLTSLTFQRGEEEEWKAEIPAESGGRRFAYEKIGAGPLALNGSKLSPLFAALTREILVLGKNTRPDVVAGDAQIALCLASSGLKKLVKNGAPVFLDMRLNGAGSMEALSFSNEPTTVWLTPRDLDLQTISLEVGESPLFADVEKRQFTAKVSESKELTDQTAFAALKAGRWLGQDFFFLHYGGETYRQLAGKQKIELNGQNALYVQPGDLICWKDNKWSLGSDPNAPLAQVQSVDESGIAFQVWNASGFESAHLKMERRKSDGILQMEKNLEHVRIRTATQVTALLGGKRVILKKGDWVLKTKNGWRNLRSVSDIQSYLMGDLVGQLFVLDLIENASDGLPVLLGKFYDEARTSWQQVTMGINQDKKSKKVKKTHKK